MDLGDRAKQEARAEDAQMDVSGRVMSGTKTAQLPKMPLSTCPLLLFIQNYFFNNGFSF